MATNRQFVLLLMIALVSSSCIRSFGGPNENAPERFEFIGVPTAREAAEAAFEGAMGPAQFADVIPGSFNALGRIPGARSDRFLAEFKVNDSELGISQCSGIAGAGGGGWGCGPIDQEQEPNSQPVALSGSGTDETWSEANFIVSDDVAYLVATASDGTNYRMEPIAGQAWMEWRSSHGELAVVAYDDADTNLGTIGTEPSR